MRFYSQSFLYDDPWSIVSLAYLLRYPNPFASHIISCDVVSRELTASGSLKTTRLILKSGSLPKWAKGMITRPETWVLEESEVDPYGKVMRCRTKNLDHVKIMRVEEHIHIRQADNGKTMQTTDARFISGFGWGLTKRIENHGLAKFKANIQRSREGFFVILDLIRQSRMQPMTMGAPAHFLTSQHRTYTPPETKASARHDRSTTDADERGAPVTNNAARASTWTYLRSWLRSG